MKGDQMSEEGLGETKIKKLRSKNVLRGEEAQTYEPVNQFMTHFNKQQKNNLCVKEAMARELADMELSEKTIQQILHLEDEKPY